MKKSREVTHNGRGLAKRNLVHYFKLVMENSGMHWSSDNEVEIEEIVESIYEDAIDTVRDEILSKELA
jgi:hypothetical protein